MSREVVADAGPLIALAITGHLPLLVELFDRVLIPEAVRDELELSSERVGPILDELREAGYRLSDPLVQHLRDLADEA